jgi:hypothetical protein
MFTSKICNKLLSGNPQCTIIKLVLIILVLVVNMMQLPYTISLPSTYALPSRSSPFSSLPSPSNSNTSFSASQETNVSALLTKNNNDINALAVCVNPDANESNSKTKEKITDTNTSDLKNITKGSVKLVFINSYWTDNIVMGGVDAGAASGQTTAQALAPVKRVEVDPGEGDSVLAIVLVNRGFVELTSITASLDLPPGFESVISPQQEGSNIALSSYDGQVDPGQTFVLYFPVKILQNAELGKEYNADLTVRYFKATDEQKGKSEVEKNTKKSSHLELNQCLDEDKNNTNRTKNNSVRHIEAKIVHTPFDSKTQTLKVPFELSGKVILDVIGLQSQDVGKNLSSYHDTINVLNAIPGVGNKLKLIINNVGSDAATGVVATVTSRTESATNNNVITPATAGNISRNVVQESSLIPIIILGGTTFNLGTIPAGQGKTIDTVVFPNNLAAGTLEILNVELSYNDAYGNKKTAIEIVGIQILPSSPQSDINVTPVPS